MKTKRTDSTSSVGRRAFLKKAAVLGAVAASASAVSAVAATQSPVLKPATENPITGETVVTPTSPLILNGPAKVGHVVLDGGQIVISGGGEIHIDRLTKR